MMKISPNDFCPCHSGKKYKKCCRPVHIGVQQPDPVQLVRARFSAYASGNLDYIMNTTHPESPHVNPHKDRWRATLDSYCLLNFHAGLEIVSSTEDRVVYTATLMHVMEGAYTFTEDALFKQVDGRWKYFDGTISNREKISLDDVAPE